MIYPSISIIIAVKNAKTLLQETLESIQTQTYKPLEVIVVDGNSTDGTKEVIKKYAAIIKEWISEEDNGISDAFNKGLKKASGEFINFQGAGDLLFPPPCLGSLFANVDPSVDLVCGKILRVEEDGITPLWDAPKYTSFSKHRFLFKMALPHQALFVHRRFFDTYGDFDLNLRFAMDYELLLRAYRHFPKTLLKDIFISKWRSGGVGKNKIAEIFDEYHTIRLRHKIAPVGLLKLIDMSTRLKYLIKAKWLNMAY